MWRDGSGRRPLVTEEWSSSQNSTCWIPGTLMSFRGLPSHCIHTAQTPAQENMHTPEIKINSKKTMRLTTAQRNGSYVACLRPRVQAQPEKGTESKAPGEGAWGKRLGKEQKVKRLPVCQDVRPWNMSSLAFHPVSHGPFPKRPAAIPNKDALAFSPTCRSSGFPL